MSPLAPAATELPDLFAVMPGIQGVMWPLVLLVAWAAGEFAFRFARVPRISIYAVVGLACASSQAGLLPPSDGGSMLFLADVAFGLILFETGYRLNLGWLKANPWIGVTSVVEATLTFSVVSILLHLGGLEWATSLLIASLTMATSPATVLRVMSERRSSGQVSERTLHFAALDCVLAVFVFLVLVGLEGATTPEDVGIETYRAGIVLVASAAMGALLGIIVPSLLWALRRTKQDASLAVAVTVILLVSFCHGFGLSAVLATLTFGMVARGRRVLLSRTDRGFGVLGDLLSLLLFVFIASTMSWTHVRDGLGLGVLIVVSRLAAKSVSIGAFARVSGISWRKGLLTGLAMSPMSAFVILMLEQSLASGIDLMDRLAPLAAAALLSELVGPILVGQAMVLAEETTDPQRV